MLFIDYNERCSRFYTIHTYRKFTVKNDEILSLQRTKYIHPVILSSAYIMCVFVLPLANQRPKNSACFLWVQYQNKILIMLLSCFRCFHCQCFSFIFVGRCFLFGQSSLPHIQCVLWHNKHYYSMVGAEKRLPFVYVSVPGADTD